MRGTEKIMSEVLLSCIVSPFRRVRMRSAFGPCGISSGVTISGPKPPVRSKFLPMVHCADLRW